MTAPQSLAYACAALVALTFGVGLRMFYVRIREMRVNRIGMQAISSSTQIASKLRDVQPSDNFKNLFEVPVLFYALCALALASSHTPSWLVIGAWLFVGLRVAHSVIHCTYNKVMHRFLAFAGSSFLLLGLWLAFVLTLGGSSAT